eukprot:371918_1
MLYLHSSIWNELQRIVLLEPLSNCNHDDCALLQRVSPKLFEFTEQQLLSWIASVIVECCFKYGKSIDSQQTMDTPSITRTTWHNINMEDNVHYHPVTVAQKYKEYKASKQRDESIEPLVETTNITKRGKRRRRRNRKKNRKLNRKTFKTLKKQFKMERIVLNNSNPELSQIFEVPSKRQWIKNEKEWLSKQKKVRAWNDGKKCVGKSFVLEEELPHIISSKADNDNKQANRLRKAQEKENKKIRNIGDAHDKNQTNNKKRKRSTKKSTQQSNKKAKIDDQFVMSDMFVEYDQDADDEDGEEDTFDFGTETVTEVENVFVSAYNLRSKNRV